jgi:hypothetical protein
VGLIGNRSRLTFGCNKPWGIAPALTEGARRQSERANWIRQDRATTVLALTAKPDGYYAPAVYQQPLTAGGMGTSSGTIVGSGTVSSASIAGGVNGVASLTGSGDITDAALGLIVSLVASLTGSGDVTVAQLVGIANAQAALTGTGDVTGALLSALGNLLADLIGTGVLSGTARADGYMGAAINVTGDVLTTANVADAVWDALIAAHLNSGSTGEKLNSAASGGDPWGTAVPGAYAAGTAGYILGTNLDAKVTELSAISTGAALNKLFDSFTLTTGTVASGTYLSTYGVDQVYHQLQDNSGTLDCYYELSLDPGRIPVYFNIVGHGTGGNDDWNVYGYRWSDSTWVQIGTVDGRASSADRNFSFAMVKSMVGSGANAGKVRVRFYGTGLTSSNLYIDQIYCGYASDESPIMFSGTAVSGGSTTIEFPSNASSIDNYYKPALIVINGGTGSGQSRRVDGYVGSTKVATVATAWSTNPDSTSTFAVYPWASVRVSDIDAGPIADIQAGLAVPGDAMTLTSGERTATATAVWASASRTLTSFGTLVADVWAYALWSGWSVARAIRKIWAESAGKLTNTGADGGHQTFHAPDGTTEEFESDTNSSGDRTPSDFGS